MVWRLKHIMIPKDTIWRADDGRWEPGAFPTSWETNWSSRPLVLRFYTNGTLGNDITIERFNAWHCYTPSSANEYTIFGG